MTRPALAYKILTPPQADAFTQQGSFAGSPVDLQDGYIHLSGVDTLLGTLNKWYADAAQVEIFEIDLSVFDKTLKWEPSRGGALFPHLYATLPFRTVTRQWTVQSVGGTYDLPKDLT
jgi:beta-hydroxylase